MSPNLALLIIVLIAKSRGAQRSQNRVGDVQ